MNLSFGGKVVVEEQPLPTPGPTPAPGPCAPGCGGGDGEACKLETRTGVHGLCDVYAGEDKAILLAAQDDGKIDIIAVSVLSKAHTLADLRNLWNKSHITDEDFYVAYAKEAPPSAGCVVRASSWYDSPAVAALTAPTDSVVTISQTDLNSYTFEKIPKDQRLIVCVEAYPVLASDTATFDVSHGGKLLQFSLHPDNVDVTAADSTNKRNWTVKGKLSITYTAAVTALAAGEYKYRYVAKAVAK